MFKREELPFTPWYTYGNHIYRRMGDRADVIFTNPKTGEKKLLVDNKGVIQNFPGIDKEVSQLDIEIIKRGLTPVIRFRTEFSKYDEERYIMLWQIQPDGRYWADDDGFGMNNDEEILLYSFLDKNGKFINPFCIYRIGDKKYV